MSHSLPTWRPSASLPHLMQRAALLRAIRTYFHTQKVLEVETPVLSKAATVDPHINSFVTHFGCHGQPDSQPLFLHTSPEFPMKRLLAAGSGDIYYLGKVFRNGDCGARHNPEFTMLEWYRLGYNHHQLMSDLSQLLQTITPFTELERVSYKTLFNRYFDCNPHQANTNLLKKLVNRYVDKNLTGINSDDCLDLLFTHVIEPELAPSMATGLQGVYVYNFPASMAALSKVLPDGQSDLVAARFELFVNGYELANGYHELTNAKEQKARFEQAQSQRKQLGYCIYPYDNHLLEALENGLPDCAGVAVGIDRLFMQILSLNKIKNVLSFSFEQA